MKELTETEFAEWRAIITDILEVFHNICLQNGLTYYGVGGTAIGAIRHKGLIPWDDDIDVAMPRPDFDKFVDLCRNQDFGKYELVDSSNLKGYNLSYPKFCNKNTTLLERYDTPCVFGLYIDVFPLDGTSDNIKEVKRLQHRYQKLRNRLEAVSTHLTFAENIKLLTKPREWGRFVVKALAFFFREPMRALFLHKMDRISRKYPLWSTSKAINYSGAYGMKELIPISLLEGKPLNVPFENISINLMPGYDKYLRGIYGDYMQLPPEDQRIAHHLKAFFDLHSRVEVK